MTRIMTTFALGVEFSVTMSALLWFLCEFILLSLGEYLRYFILISFIEFFFIVLINCFCWVKVICFVCAGTSPAWTLVERYHQPLVTWETCNPCMFVWFHRVERLTFCLIHISLLVLHFDFTLRICIFLAFRDLQGSKLTGQIPDEIGNCAGLVHL